MSDIDKLLDDFDDEDVYYDPEMSTIIPEGSYPAKIIGLYSKKITTKRGGRGMLYKPKYQLNAGKYEGRDVQDAGVWRFYGIKDEDGRRITGGSNAGYKRFLDKLHIPLQKLELDGNSDAESRVVLKLPAITTDLILDKSVVISVAHEEWTGMHGNRNISATATLVRLRNGSVGEQETS